MMDKREIYCQGASCLNLGKLSNNNILEPNLRDFYVNYKNSPAFCFRRSEEEKMDEKGCLSKYIYIHPSSNSFQIHLKPLQAPKISTFALGVWDLSMTLLKQQ